MYMIDVCYCNFHSSRDQVSEEETFRINSDFKIEMKANEKSAMIFDVSEQTQITIKGASDAIKKSKACIFTCYQQKI